MNFGSRTIASILAGTARIVTGATVRWYGEGPVADQRVYFANHSSHLDFLVLWAALPAHVRTRTRPVAAADYWSSGIRRYLATEVFRAILVERGVAKQGVAKKSEPDKDAGDGRRMDAIRRMAKALETGDSLIFFPEGTRNLGKEVAPFKSGLYYLCAVAPAIKLVPVYLENFSRVLPKGEVLPVPLICKLSFGPSIQLHDGEEKSEFLARARTALCELKGI
jgi:1-acyl-sn-glycerol-3-phosphate acyltransferase